MYVSYICLIILAMRTDNNEIASFLIAYAIGKITLELLNYVIETKELNNVSKIH